MTDKPVLPQVDETFGLSQEEYQRLATLLARYQVAMKKDIYADFKAKDILDFLFTYVYQPGEDRSANDSAWATRFKSVFLRYGRNWETVRRQSSGKFMGAGKALLDSVGLMFRFYALTDQLDTEMLEVLAGKFKGKVMKLEAMPQKEYEAAFRQTDPGGGRRRLQVQLADDLLGIVITVAKSPMAMGGIRAGLALASRFAPPGFKDVIPFAQKIIEEGLKVLGPYMNNADPLRREMLDLEEAYIRRVLGE